MDTWDVTIVGGGILGTSLAYWLANRYRGRIAVLEREHRVAQHGSRRNTGVIHRPFYLDPEKRRVFARSSQAAYGMWKSYAPARGLPFAPVGTLEVATEEWMVHKIETYREWGQKNGMAADELEVLSPQDVRRLEPNVECFGAIWSKTDTAVDYERYTEALREDAEREGAQFLLGVEVESVEAAGDVLSIRVRPTAPESSVYMDSRERISASPDWAREPIRTRFLINAAGGNAVDIARMLDVGTEYTDLHFRGEYWTVRPEHHYLARRNVYSVAKHPDLPFLDPHWIVRASGRVEIGPNAVPITGPHTYHGFFEDFADVPKKFFEKPVWNKIAVLFNPDFMTLATQEWASSVSKTVMANRVRKFLPAMRVDFLDGPGTAGVRSNVLDRDGNFLKEAIELEGPHSYHIVNYNSPGATGAPAFGAWVVKNLGWKGHLDHLAKKDAPSTKPWDFDAVTKSIEAPDW
jgi:(S)-2-hydroxyglutarate dehydrogenase